MTSAANPELKGHRFHPTLLREYDLRGRVGETLHESDALALGRAVGAMAMSEGRTRLAVGYDGRLSSPALERALVEGLVRSGLRRQQETLRLVRQRLGRAEEDERARTFAIGGSRDGCQVERHRRRLRLPAGDARQQESPQRDSGASHCT